MLGSGRGIGHKLRLTVDRILCGWFVVGCDHRKMKPGPIAVCLQSWLGGCLQCRECAGWCDESGRAGAFAQVGWMIGCNASWAVWGVVVVGCFDSIGLPKSSAI